MTSNVQRSELRPRVRRGWRAFFAGSLGLLILSSWASTGAGPTVSQEALPETPFRGWLLFEEKHCHRCHAIDSGGQGVGPDLVKGHFIGSFLNQGAALWNHVPGMQVQFEAADLPWPQLSGAEVLELTAFLYYVEYLGRPGNAETGQRLFTSKGCAACHTIGGQGKKVGPELGDLKHFASPLYIAQAIWEHGPSMLESMREMKIRPPSFEEGDLADLSAYVRQAARPGPLQRVLQSPGNPRHGREVFGAKGCATCHPVRGRGGAGGPDLGESDLHRSADAIAGTMWNHALVMSASMREKGMGWPKFTTDEFADLIAYLYFIPFVDAPGDPVKGQKVFANRTCADCHTVGTSSAHPGPDLTKSEAAGSPATLVAAMWNHAPVMREAILEEGRPWPELQGEDLRNLLAYIKSRSRGN